MDSQLENSNHKREHIEDNSDQNKRKKPEMPEEAIAMTNFTDVNDDCLVHIFKYLKLRDLINIADTSKRFQTSTQTVFASKCRGMDIELHPSSSNRIQPIKFIGNTVEISDMTSCLKVLRHFGGVIPEQHVSYYKLEEDKKDALAWYMNEYCADSLVDVKVSWAKKEETTNWTKPFSKANSLVLRYCNLGDLSKWFPNVRRLVLTCSSQSIKSTLPHLEELKINIGEYKYGCDIASTTEMLRLNQHLKILRLSGSDCDMEFLESVSGYLQSVRLLDIDCDHGFFNTEGGSIHLKSVNELNINLLLLNSLPEIPFIFDKLKTIKLTITEFKLNDNFKNFIRANPSLTKLKIYAWADTLKSTSINQIKSNLAEVSPSLDVEFVPNGNIYVYVISDSDSDSE